MKTKIRQKVRRGLLTVSLLLLPVTLYYFSPALSLQGPAAGAASGSVLVFAGLFVSALLLGQAFCGRACPLGGLQELTARLRGRPVARRPPAGLPALRELQRRLPHEHRRPPPSLGGMGGPHFRLTWFAGQPSMLGGGPYLILDRRLYLSLNGSYLEGNTDEFMIGYGGPSAGWLLFPDSWFSLWLGATAALGRSAGDWGAWGTALPGAPGSAP